MSLVIMGLGHRSASLAAREAASVAAGEVPAALAALAGAEGVKEAVLISTCNRVEVLVDAKTDRLGADAAERFFRARMGQAFERDCLYLHRGIDAVRHLLRVVCSLDSQVLGEAQILGQVRRAYEQAQAAGTCGEVTTELLKRALHLGKRVRSETAIGTDSVSLSTLAYRAAMEGAPDRRALRVLLVGAGEMARLAARYLADDAVADVRVANRTAARAAELARAMGARTAAFADRYREAAECDVVFAMTAADGPVIRAGELQAARRAAGRDGAPLALVDAGMPHNVERACGDLPGVTLHGIESISARADEGMARRMDAVPEAERLVEEAERGFLAWMQERLVAPTIKAIHEKGAITVEDELARARKALERERGAAISPGEERVLEQYGNAIMKKLLHGPTVRLRKEAATADSYYYTGAARYLFGVETFPPGTRRRCHPHACAKGASCPMGRGDAAREACAGENLDAAPSAPAGVVRIGTRGSALALWQAHAVEDALKRAFPDVRTQVVEVSTTGDRVPDAPLEQIGDKGLFTKDLEAALIAGEVDLCVHSMKDLPAELPAGCAIGAVLPRADARDVLVCGPRLAGARSLADLPAGARLGTGSQRRTAQLRARFPQVEPLPMRGNVDTRLRKAAGDGYDGAVMAAAGVLRMGAADAVAAFIPVEDMVPAVGQGAIGVEVRADDARIRALCRAVDDAPTRACVAAERAVLAALEGGCQAPIGAYARYGAGGLVMDATVLSPDGAREARVRRVFGRDVALREAAAAVVCALEDRGARAILADIARTAGGAGPASPGAGGGGIPADAPPAAHGQALRAARAAAGGGPASAAGPITGAGGAR